MRSTFACLILGMALTGCVSAPKHAVKKDVQNSIVLDQTYEETWSKLVSYATKHGMSIKTIDKSSGLMAFDRADDSYFSDTHMDCGTPHELFGIQYKGPITFNFTVEKVTEKTTRTTVNLFEGVAYGNSLNQKIPCFSKGTYEKEVFCELEGKPCPTPLATPTPKPKAKQY